MFVLVVEFSVGHTLHRTRLASFLVSVSVSVSTTSQGRFCSEGNAAGPLESESAAHQQMEWNGIRGAVVHKRVGFRAEHMLWRAKSMQARKLTTVPLDSLQNGQPSPAAEGRKVCVPRARKSRKKARDLSRLCSWMQRSTPSVAGGDWRVETQSLKC